MVFFIERFFLSFFLLYSQVLRTLMFLNRQNVIQLKGCVACEIHSHEVLLTELLFTNIFGHFEPPEIAALLSCVIFQQVFSYIIGGRYLLLSCFNKGWFL